MTRERLLLTLVVALVMLNGVVLFVFMTQGNRPGQPPHDRVIIETLGLDDSQQRTFDVLKRDHRRQMDSVDRIFAGVLQDYFALLNEPAQPKKDSLEQVIADLERARVRITHAHFNDLRSLCRPGQKEEFDRFLPELVKFILPPKKKHHRPEGFPR